MIPVGILPDRPIQDMVVACAHNNSEKGLELDKPQLRVEYSIAIVPFGRRYHSHTLIPLILFDYFSLGLVAHPIDHEERHLRPGYRVKDLHFKPVVGYHNDLDVLAHRFKGKGIDIRVQKTREHDVVCLFFF
jgi:hypothetical protein